MRAAATSALIALIALPAVAQAQSDAGARLDVYVDEDLVVVVPAASVHLEPKGSNIDIDVGWMANVLSGATPLLTADVVTSATRFDDVRNAIDVAVSGQPNPLTTVKGTARVSLEEDYLVAATSIGVQQEVGKRMAVLSASYTALFEQAWTVHHDGTKQGSMTHRADIGSTLLLSRSTRLALTASGLLHACGEVIGCHANPYRFVLVTSPDSVLAVRELHPSSRARVAAKVKLSQAIGRHVALHGGYRFYIDSWQVQGHTGELDVGLGFMDERILLRLGGRMTRQTAASFYSRKYEASSGLVPGVRTGDRELAGLWSWRVGGRLELAWLGVGRMLRVAVHTRLHHTWYRYPDYPWAPRRNAWVGGLGVDAEF